LPGHHSIPLREGRGTALEETLLRGHHPSLDRYAAALKQRSNGWGRRALRRLKLACRIYGHKRGVSVRELDIKGDCISGTSRQAAKVATKPLLLSHTAGMSPGACRRRRWWYWKI